MMADTTITAIAWPSVMGIGGGDSLHEPEVAAALRVFNADSNIVYGFSVPADVDIDTPTLLTIAQGEAIINGYRVATSASVDVECPDDVDGYIYLKLVKNVLGYVTRVAIEVNTTGVQPADSVPICKTSPDSGKLYTSSILSGSQLTIGGKYAVIAGILQHTATGWAIKANTKSTNIQSAYDDDTFECIYVNYQHLDVARVVSMVVTPGFGLAEDGVSVGVTATSNNATITFSGARVGGYVEFTQASGVPVIHSGYGLTGITLDDPWNLPRFFIDHYGTAGEAALISPYDGYTVLPTVASMTAKQTEITVSPGTDYHFYFLRESVGVITPSLLELNREITVLGIVELNR